MQSRKLKLKPFEPYALLLPAILLIILFFGYPLLEGIRLSFVHYVLCSTAF